MSTEKMRKSFQEWANTHYLLSELNWAIEDGEYEEPEMQYAWKGWQASRASIEVELPSLRAITMGRRENEHYSGFNAGVELCIDAIESLGLKVKP